VQLRAPNTAQNTSKRVGSSGRWSSGWCQVRAWHSAKAVIFAAV
jgi:hypothetical protein